MHITVPSTFFADVLPPYFFFSPLIAFRRHNPPFRPRRRFSAVFVTLFSFSTTGIKSLFLACFRILSPTPPPFDLRFESAVTSMYFHLPFFLSSQFVIVFLRCLFLLLLSRPFFALISFYHPDRRLTASL